MPLLRRSRDLHLTLRSRHNDTILVQPRRHRIGIQNRPHTLNIRYKKPRSATYNATKKKSTEHTALRTGLIHIRTPRVRRAPIQRLRIRMHPKEPPMPPLSMSLPNRLPRIFVQKLPNHRLRNRMDNNRISATLTTNTTRRHIRHPIRRRRRVRRHTTMVYSSSSGRSHTRVMVLR